MDNKIKAAAKCIDFGISQEELEAQLAAMSQYDEKKPVQGAIGSASNKNEIGQMRARLSPALSQQPKANVGRPLPQPGAQNPKVNVGRPFPKNPAPVEKEKEKEKEVAQVDFRGVLKKAASTNRAEKGADELLRRPLTEIERDEMRAMGVTEEEYRIIKGSEYQVKPGDKARNFNQYVEAQGKLLGGHDELNERLLHLVLKNSGSN